MDDKTLKDSSCFSIDKRQFDLSCDVVINRQREGSTVKWGFGVLCERESANKKEREKSENAELEKKARIRAFSSPYSGNPVSEPKAARQGESKGLE